MVNKYTKINIQSQAKKNQYFFRKGSNGNKDFRFGKSKGE